MAPLDADRWHEGVVSAVKTLRLTCLWYAGTGLGFLLHHVAYLWGLT